MKSTMAVRQIVRNKTHFENVFKYIGLTTDPEKETAVLSMRRKPVNSMNLEMLNELHSAIDSVEKDKAIRGLVLTSDIPKNFSSGLDISEIHQPEPQRLTQFWTAFQELWIRLYGSRLATVAAINGNSPAGGCILAISCDYRIMAQGKFMIGLSETQLGIAPSRWVQNTMCNTIGFHQAEHALSLGKLFSAEQAHKLQLVDELVPADDLVPAAHNELKRWLRVPELSRTTMKSNLRQPTIKQMLDTRAEDIDFLNSQTLHENTQNTIAKFLEKMKK